MTDEEVYKRIEETYKSEKGKPFITHLLKSFFPTHKSEFLWDDPEDKREMKCCITGDPLMSKGEAFKKATEDIDKDLKLFAGAVIEQFEEGNVGEKQKELLEFRRKKFGGKVLAVTTTESNKLLSSQAAQQLFNFYANEILKGNGHMNWIGRSLQKKEFVKSLDKRGLPLTQKENQTLNKVVNKPHKSTLADNEVLNALRKKLEGEN